MITHSTQNKKNRTFFFLNLLLPSSPQLFYHENTFINANQYNIKLLIKLNYEINPKRRKKECVQ